MDLKLVQIDWMQDILLRISEINNNSSYTEHERQKVINWLIKQALKVNRDD
jgi:hypothetical protein